MTQLTHWYHVWCGPGSRWREPVEEHMYALARAKFTGAFKVGIVGLADARAEVLEIITAQRPPDRVVEFDDGWEQPTLKLVHADAKRHRRGITLYCHTKGAAYGDPRLQSAWRRSMTCALLAYLPENVRLLEDGCDAVGCHWLAPLPDTGAGFGGNFWMARNRFLATLPPVGETSRWDAEGWIGCGGHAPVVRDLNPGFPAQVPWVHAIGWPR